MFGDYVRKLFEHTIGEIDAACEVLQHRDRPKALRKFDQIYMLAGSQLTQVKLISEYLHDKRVVFVGDGDCMSLLIAHLASKGIIGRPSHMKVYDFDRRLLAFIRSQKALGWDDDIHEYIPYNVRDPIPLAHKYDADVFYTNPPYGYSNEGLSGQVFLSRCMELCKHTYSQGVAILPYDFGQAKPQAAMKRTQEFLISHGYVISEMLRGMHRYDLDDRPTLASCTVVMDRVEFKDPAFAGRAILNDELAKFYGSKTITMPDYVAEDGTEEFSPPSAN